MKRFFQKNSFYVFLIFIFNLHYFLWGERNHIIIPDNLNLEFLFRHLLKISNNLFNFNSNSLISNIYSSGLEISHIHSRLNILDLFFYLLPSYLAYALNNLAVRVIGYFSFLNLLNDVKYNSGYSKLISLSFALLPILPIYGLTVIGLPLLFSAFFNLAKNQKIWASLFFIILYIVYSTPLTYPFIILWLTIIMVYIYFNRTVYNFSTRNIFIGITFFITCFSFTELGLLNNIFEDSHRSLLANYPSENVSVQSVIYYLGKNLIFGRFHPSLLINISAVIFLVLIFKKKTTKISLIIFLIFICNIIIFAFRTNIQNILGSISPVFYSLNFGRSIWLNPFISYLLLVIIFKDLINKKRFVLIVTCLSIMLNLIRNPEFSINYFGTNAKILFDEEKIIFKLARSKDRLNWVEQYGLYSYKDYFSSDLFDEIKSSLNINTTSNNRVINIGLNPAIPLYNGFFTVDGATTSHSLEYHYLFDKIQKDYNIKANHGLSIENKNYDLKKINLNFDLLKSLNCNYIFSDSKLINTPNNIELMGLFKNHVYNIYVYKINYD